MKMAILMSCPGCGKTSWADAWEKCPVESEEHGRHDALRCPLCDYIWDMAATARPSNPPNPWKKE